MVNFFKKGTEVKFYAPLTGKVLELADVPDPAFAEKMLGDGLAIEPTDGLVVAPVAGKIVQIFPANHALGIETKEGLDVLIHIGIDTVELQGEGFERLIKEGAKVKVGDPLIKVDLDKIKRLGKSIITPIIITTMDLVQDLSVNATHVQAGLDLILTLKLK